MTSTAKPKSKLALFLNKHISAISHRKSQREIAEEVGWNKPNMVSMIKSGNTRVPWGSVPALAAAIDADPAELFRLAVDDYWPEAHLAIGQIFGTIVTKNEKEFLNHVRTLFGGSVPPLSVEMRRELDAALSRWRPR